MKISASGQAVGGDMLVGRRVGFSGTPSDLLPQELGRCDYETGDDGMMLTTVLDRAVTSYEFLKDQWTVEILLEHIATAENPRFNALIDTGALITGYSNKEVAQQLLDRGLKWCEGIVFLDDDDRQQVLVRATGRVVSADQCGVPLEKRFAFYDQIHTTGMDIKHVVNATAVITLGKDMVFRDYVQGAYRMRGIGAGQKIHVFIIPEVAELMKRELHDAVIPPHPQTHEHVLEDVVAWLIINSLRSEQVQWTMLCLQNIGNLYRKNAFQSLHRGTKYFMEGGTVPIPLTQGEEESKISSEESFIAKLDRDKALKLFDEPIDFSLEAGVPDPVPFEERLRSMLDTHEAFLQPEQHAIGHKYDSLHPSIFLSHPLFAVSWLLLDNLLCLKALPIDSILNKRESKSRNKKKKSKLDVINKSKWRSLLIVSTLDKKKFKDLGHFQCWQSLFQLKSILSIC
jgi:hypothetical protein